MDAVTHPGGVLAAVLAGDLVSSKSQISALRRKGIETRPGGSTSAEGMA